MSNTQEIASSSPSSGEKKRGAFKFKNFEIAADYSDHHYIGKNQSAKEKEKLSDGNKPVYKKIMNECRILEKHLPETIFVRVYEQRIDLLRAMIIGASGTPYHDGLFFFDIAFPSRYPDEPPKVYYHSHGLRLNPNLYASGYVCLSLINTWHGSKVEKWTPKKSTILQLLLSLQGLVLNEEPYFNEPGYQSRRAVSEKLSTNYNADAFLLSCRTMIYTLHKPPKNFEGIVNAHFGDRRDHIVESFMAYRDSLAAIGRYQKDGPSSSSSVDVQKKFQTADSKKLLDQLKRWFDAIKVENDIVLTEEVQAQMKDSVGVKNDEEPSGLKAKIEVLAVVKKDNASSGSKAESSTLTKPKQGILKRLMNFW